MCGCFIFKKKSAEQVADDLEIGSNLLETTSEDDVRPGMSPAVIVSDASGISATSMFWGYPMPYRKLIINARSETAPSKQLFKLAMQKQRCIIPATAFYEWDSNKTKVTFCREDEHVIYLAGIYLFVEAKKQFVILTTAANKSMIRVHDRMPLMIEAKDVNTWLFDSKQAEKMLKSQMPLLKSTYSCHQLTFIDL